MTITITPSHPQNYVGPGILLPLSSSFIGPLPTGSGFQLTLTTTPGEIQLGTHFVPTTTPQLTPKVMLSPGSNITFGPGYANEGQAINVSAVLKDPGGVTIDTGSQPASWSSIVGLPTMITDKTQGGGTGTGLTPEEAQQLDQTHASTFPAVLPLQVAPVLVPSAGPGASIVLELPQPTFGIIVRLNQLPDGLAPQTPDEQYWVRSLAVVRIFRDNDLWLRVPVHTPTKIIGLWNEFLVTAVSELFTVGWQPGIRLLVDFLEGAAGDVFLMPFP